MDRFCTRKQERVDINDDKENQTCVHGLEVDCQEAKCRYTLGVVMRTKFYGESAKRFPDYTIDLKAVPAPTETSDAVPPPSETSDIERPIKKCDTCGGPGLYGQSYLFDYRTVLQSNGYIDRMIRKWEHEGTIPSEMLVGGISEAIRERARDHIHDQTGDTPWSVCERCCLGEFEHIAVEDREEAKKRGSAFWDDETVSGVYAKKLPAATVEEEETGRQKTKWTSFAESCARCNYHVYPVDGAERLGYLLGVRKKEIVWKRFWWFLAATIATYFIIRGIVLYINEWPLSLRSFVLPVLTSSFFPVALGAAYYFIGSNRKVVLTALATVVYMITKQLVYTMLGLSLSGFSLMSFGVYAVSVTVCLMISLRYVKRLWIAAGVGLWAALFLVAVSQLLWSELYVYQAEGTFTVKALWKVFYVSMPAVLFGILLAYAHTKTCVNCAT